MTCSGTPALSYSSRGAEGAVAVVPCGTALTDVQAAIVTEMTDEHRGVIVATDGDTAGHGAADKVWELLRAAPGPLRIAVFTPGQDPSDLLRQPNGTGRAALRTALQRRARPLLDALVDHRLDRLTTKHPRLLEDVGGRRLAVDAVVPLLTQATEPGHAGRLAEHIAARVSVGLDTVLVATAAHVDSLVASYGTDIAAIAARGTARPPPAAAGFPPHRVATPPPAAVRTAGNATAGRPAGRRR